MREHDSVVLTQDIPAHGLSAGDVGTIVLVHRGGAGFEIEFTTLPARRSPCCRCWPPRCGRSRATRSPTFARWPVEPGISGWSPSRRLRVAKPKEAATLCGLRVEPLGALVEPGSVSHPERPAQHSKLAGVRSLWISLWRVGIVLVGPPVPAPLANIAGHVQRPAPRRSLREAPYRERPAPRATVGPVAALL
jgi:hypothetical protein